MAPERETCFRCGETYAYYSIDGKQVDRAIHFCSPRVRSAAVKEPTIVLESRHNQVAETVTCHNCGTRLGVHMQYCWKCGNPTNTESDGTRVY